MKRTKVQFIPAAVALALVLGACQPQQPQFILSKKSAVELRAMQSRVYDTNNKNKTLRAVVATLQDLGYYVDKIEPTSGTVSATKLSLLRISVAVYPRGSSQLIVRSNALVMLQPGAVTQNQVDDPAFYQQRFFEPLSKALFLTALQIEDKDDAPMPALPSTPPRGASETTPENGSASGEKSSSPTSPTKDSSNATSSTPASQNEE